MTALQPIFVRASHVQPVFGIHRSTLYRWVNEGRVTLHKHGRSSFVKVADLTAIIEGLGGQMGGQTAEKAN